MTEQSQQEISSESLEFSFSELNSDSPVIITEQEVKSSDYNCKKETKNNMEAYCLGTFLEQRVQTTAATRQASFS